MSVHEGGRAEALRRSKAGPARSAQIGSIGYLIVFFWSLGLVLTAPPARILAAACLSLLVAVILYPKAFRRLLQLRWLALAGILVLVNLLWIGETEHYLWRLPVSTAGLQSGLQMVLRAMVVLVAVDGFSNAVDIAEVAGMLERFGLRGLGFSLGVAINLLPSLRQSAGSAWNSLRMRGGLRHRRWRGLQLFFITVGANALRRAEEIALAAETRAFSPENSRPLPVRVGRLDGLIGLAALISAVSFWWL